MEKPLLEFKRFGRKTQRIIEKRAKVCGMEFMGGPQGQVLHIVSHRAKRGLSTFIRDIEHELDISKSVASNLIKRMEKNGSIFLEVSETDKRAKMIHLTAQSKQQLKELHDFLMKLIAVSSRVFQKKNWQPLLWLWRNSTKILRN